MSTHDDTAGNGALTPEERALAQRLARLGAQGEPSSALDARILAAAHAATETPIPAPMRRRSDRPRKAARWPTAFGFAASLALACGIAWQLRPVTPTGVSAKSEAVGEEPLADYHPPAPSMSVRAIPPRPLNMPAPPPPAEQPRQPARRAAIRDATPADVEQKPQAFDDAHFVDEAVHGRPQEAAAAAAVAPPPPAAEAADIAATSAAPAPAPMAAPAPAAPPAAAKASANMQQRAADSAELRREAAAAAAASDAIRAAEPEYAEPDEEVVPPATADSPEVRDAWLLRIRELMGSGHLGAARESLEAFRARYPDHPLPDDLRPLEE